MSEVKEFNKKIKKILDFPCMNNIFSRESNVMNTLKNIALDSKMSFYQRVNAYSYLCKTSYTYTEEYVKECGECMITDITVSPDDRFAFLEDRSYNTDLYKKLFDSILESPCIPANKQRICKLILEKIRDENYIKRARDYLNEHPEEKFYDYMLIREGSNPFADSYRCKRDFYKKFYKQINDQYNVYEEKISFYLTHPKLFYKMLRNNKRNIKLEFFYGLELYDNYKSSRLSEQSYLELFADVYLNTARNEIILYRSSFDLRKREREGHLTKKDFEDFDLPVYIDDLDIYSFMMRFMLFASFVVCIISIV